MSSISLDEILTHMEFLGYEIEKKEEGQFVARHESNGNIIGRPYQGGVLFQQYWVLNKYNSANRSECLEAINDLNSGANVSTYVISTDSDGDTLLRMDACYFGLYDKKTFGVFLESYNTDTAGRLAQNETLRALI
jgi:hypothetical protein